MRMFNSYVSLPKGMLIDRNWRYHTNNRVSSLNYFLFEPSWGIIFGFVQKLWIKTSSTWPCVSMEKMTQPHLFADCCHRQGATCIIPHLIFCVSPKTFDMKVVFFLNHVVSSWWFGTWLLFSIYWECMEMSSSQLTFIFFWGVEITHQV